MVVLGLLILGFFLFEFAGYLIHRLLHFPFMGPLYKAHQAHHFELYPPGDYLSETYRSAGGRSTVYLFLPFALVLVSLLIYFLPFWLSIPLLIELAVIGAINDKVHDALHIKSHWLERFSFFHKLRELHRIHHEDVSVNFGIWTFFSDKFMKTFKL